MKLFTKKDWQHSMTVALFQSWSTVLPTNGNRWMLWVILPMGMILTMWASWWCMHDTLYRWLFTSGQGWKGVNHSTYAKCSGGWLFIGNKSRCTAGLMLKTAWTCATQWADGLSAVGMLSGMRSPWTPLTPSFLLWTSISDPGGCSRALLECLVMCYSNVVIVTWVYVSVLLCSTLIPLQSIMEYHHNQLKCTTLLPQYSIKTHNSDTMLIQDKMYWSTEH